MKKCISILLALLMVCSCFGVLSAAADPTDESTTKQNFFENLSDLVGIDFSNALTNPDLVALFQDDSSFEELLAEGYFKDKRFMGLDIDFMYNSSEPLIWSTVVISRSDLALVYGNLNAYLLKLKKEKFNDFSFYTNEHATQICNFLGHLYDPEFTDLKITFDNNPTTSDIFYKTICERSGLTEWLSQQWFHNPKETYYVAMCTTLGMKVSDLPAPERDIKDPEKVVPLLVKSFVEYKAKGPIAFLLDLIHTFVLTYDFYLSRAAIPFFQKYIDAELITEEQLYSIKGLLNQIANGNDKNAVDKDGVPKPQLIAPPAYRFAITSDEVENFLYLVVYCNMVGVYGNNKQPIEKYKARINGCADFDDVQKERLTAIVGLLFECRVAEAVPVLLDISKDLITAVPDNVKNMFLGFFGRFIDAFWNIVDKIYQAIRNLL